MQIISAQSAGFCLGVSLALKSLDRELLDWQKQGQGRLLTLGPIIHNPLVMQSYAEQGVIMIEDPGEARPGDRVVVRAHGITREQELAVKQAGVRLVDATCPKVKKAQIAIGRTSARGGTLLLFGERDHPEVRGLLSYAGTQALVFGSLEELEKLELDPALPYFLAAQTTQERHIFVEAAQRAAKRLGRSLRVLETICDATRARQDEVEELCAVVRAMVVVGGFNSGNTRRLAEVARSAGVPALHVERSTNLEGTGLEMLRASKGPIGLTAGASTPQEHIEAVKQFLERSLAPEEPAK